MSSPLHSRQTVSDGLHSAIAYVYADEATRIAAAGFITEDRYKLAYVTATQNVWLLTDVTGPTWIVATSGVTFTEASHEALRELIHLAAEGGPFEQFPGCIRDIGPAGSPFPTASIWWDGPDKQHKIVEKLVTYNANRTPATVRWITYVSGSASVAASVTDTISYQGVFETSRTRTQP